MRICEGCFTDLIDDAFMASLSNMCIGSNLYTNRCCRCLRKDLVEFDIQESILEHQELDK